MEILEDRTGLQEQLKDFETRLENLQHDLKEKFNEVDKKNAIIGELQLQVDKLEDDVMDKTKVSDKFWVQF